MEKPALADTLLWDIDTASQQLGLSKRYVQILVKQHELEYVRIGRRVLFDPAYLREWIKTRTVPARAAS